MISVVNNKYMHKFYRQFYYTCALFSSSSSAVLVCWYCRDSTVHLRIAGAMRHVGKDFLDSLFTLPDAPRIVVESFCPLWHHFDYTLADVRRVSLCLVV